MTAVERYHLARRTLGSPYTITFLITYASASRLPDEKALRYRIMELQDHFALLNARIQLPSHALGTEGGLGAGVSSGSGARWQERPTLQGSANFFSRETYPAALAADSTTGSDKGQAVEEWILQSSTVEWADEEPLWRVRYYTASGKHSDERREALPGTSSGSGSAPVESKAYMAVSVAHELTDGIGLVRLVQALLADDIDDLPYEGLVRPAEGQKDGSGAGGWAGWLSRTVHDLLPSRRLSETGAPTRYTSSASDDPAHIPASSWPTGSLPPNYTTSPHKVALHTLSSEIIASLKSLSQYHGIPTLTPVLHLSFLAAVHAVMQPKEALTSVIPFSERDAETGKGDRRCTGQYTAAHWFELDLTNDATLSTHRVGVEGELLEAGQATHNSRSEEVQLWASARRLAYQLAHPEHKAIARRNIHLLDTLTAPVDDTSGRDPFVIHLEKQAASDHPFPQSVSFSNIGKVPLPAGATAVAIAGTCAVGDPPFEVVLSGTEEKGLVATVAYRDGVVLKGEQVRMVLGVWEGVLKDLLVDGREVGVVQAGQAAFDRLRGEGKGVRPVEL